MHADTSRTDRHASRRKAELFSCPETLGEALYQLVHNSPQPVSEQAKLLNLSPQFVYNCANPNLAVEGVAYPLKHLIPHTQLTKNRVVIDFIEQQLGYVAVAVNPQPDLFRRSVLTSSVSGDMLCIAKEMGEASAAIQKSIRDGKLTTTESKKCRKEIWDLVQCAVRLHEELAGVE